MKKKLVKSAKVLYLGIKSIHPMQKYPHITEPCACILKMFVIMFLLPMNFLISLGMCSTPKLSK